MMTDHELTEMVLRVMRQQLEEKMNGSAGSGLQRGALDCLEQRSPAEQGTFEWGSGSCSC